MFFLASDQLTRANLAFSTPEQPRAQNMLNQTPLQDPDLGLGPDQSPDRHRDQEADPIPGPATDTTAAIARPATTTIPATVIASVDEIDAADPAARTNTMTFPLMNTNDGHDPRRWNLQGDPPADVTETETGTEAAEAADARIALAATVLAPALAAPVHPTNPASQLYPKKTATPTPSRPPAAIDPERTDPAVTTLIASPDAGIGTARIETTTATAAMAANGPDETVPSHRKASTGLAAANGIVGTATTPSENENETDHPNLPKIPTH